MHRLQMVAIAAILVGALPGCATQPDLALTQWGTPCADYGLSAKACHAKYANYRDYLARPKPDPSQAK